MLAFLTSYLSSVNAQGTWTALTNYPLNTSGGLMLLLSDGSVMVKSSDYDGAGTVWNRLVPDANGSYVNGTWQPMAAMNFSRLYCSTRVLKDGRVYIAGGEYGTGLSNAEIYDPATDSWTIIQDTITSIADANCELLPDGEILQAQVDYGGDSTYIFNPATNTYRIGPRCLRMHDESAWLKLPDNSILFNDFGSRNTERYIPSLNHWLNDAVIPDSTLYTYIGETGPSFLLPNGKAVFFGGSGHNAIYTPSGSNAPGSWVRATDFPNGFGMPDAAGAMMPNGKILCTASPHGDSANPFPSPTAYYEYDYTRDTFLQVTGPYGLDTASIASYVTCLLDLPDGTVLYTELGSYNYFIYTPDDTPVAAGKPTVAQITRNDCNLFTATGTLFNGISEGAAYGDDWQMATNYPIVRLTNGNLVYYAHSFNWNRTGVQTGNLPDTTQFELPVYISPGSYQLQVIANGIASDPFPFTVPDIGLTSPLSSSVCSNSQFVYNVTSNASATYTWTRSAVNGISNAAVTTPQSTTPSEVLVNTTTQPVNVTYTFVASGGCPYTQNVTVAVNPTPTAAISGPDTVCYGHSITLTATGAGDYYWSSSDYTASIMVSPTTTTNYTVTVENSYGCSQTASHQVEPTICAGIDPVTEAANAITLIPNPANNQVQINYTFNVPGPCSLTLYDICGRPVVQQNIYAMQGANQYVLPLNEVAKGIYLVTVQRGVVEMKTRLVVQ